MKESQGKENAILPVIPTIDVVVFPHMVVPLLVVDEHIINGVRHAHKNKTQVLLLATKAQKSDQESVGISDLYTLGTVGEVIRIMDLHDGGIKVLIQGLQKANAIKIETRNDMIEAVVALIHQGSATSRDDIAPLIQKITHLAENTHSSGTIFNGDFSAILSQMETPEKMCDYILSHLSLSVAESQELLECSDLVVLLNKVIAHIEKMITSTEVEETIRTSTRESINKSQREYYLREQLRAIQKELGDDVQSDIVELADRAKNALLNAEARSEVDRQIARLERTAPDSLEATVIRNHIEWIIDLPWGKYTKDSHNITFAKETLDEGHFGLEEVKERILDYLSVKYLKDDCHSPILCLAGPPGVGKTSLGKSIAASMERQFARIALGGVHDEAEVRGHRRTYVGALPGRFIQAIKKAGSSNPIIMLDEIDKVGSSHKGDPAAALLEALDPEQNNAFYDNYLGVHFDLSKILFIATANDISSIPAPLRDRMEIIELSGYTHEEKIEIAQRHLISAIVADSGLAKTSITFSRDVINELIMGYTMEAGVRTLSKLIRKLCAKFARTYIESGKEIVFTPENLAQYIGPQQNGNERVSHENKVGITNGLAWTPFGGQTLQVEAVLIPGNGKLILTGKLGEVMKESAQAAVSYARSHAEAFAIAPELFTNYDLHIHLPAGAIPKDGPSAGITLISSIFSVYTKRPINGNFAMTGELNLQGDVLPIGGVKEKLLAAKQRGFSNVIFPRQNERDIKAITPLPEGLTIHFVDSVEEVLAHVLQAQA